MRNVKIKINSNHVLKKRIAHLDMDAFFASIEQRDNPLLRGKPVIVGGTAESRGVVSTCSYEARAYGVHSAMPIREAQRKCPYGIFIEGNGAKYVSASRQLVKILLRFTPRVEPVSIDEAFLDISGANRLYGTEENLAGLIKATIHRELGLTATIGIAPNKIMAKIASDLKKPDGLTIVRDNEIESKIYPLPVSAMWGVGKRTIPVLRKLGITTIGDLARTSEETLKKWFGKNGVVLVQMAKGEVDSAVLRPSDIPDEKSIGHEHTFSRDIDDFEELTGELRLLAQLVGRRMRKHGFVGKRVTLKYRYENFETHTHQMTLLLSTNLDDIIYLSVRKLLQEKLQKGRKIRLLGISVSLLSRQDEDLFLPLSFLEEKQIEKRKKLFSTLDQLKDHYGEMIITNASVLKLE